MKEFVEYLIKQVVSQPDRVVVHEFKSEATTILEVKVDRSDMGRIIGKDGRVIEAIRMLARAVYKKNHQHVQVELVE